MEDNNILLSDEELNVCLKSLRMFENHLLLVDMTDTDDFLLCKRLIRKLANIRKERNIKNERKN